MTKIRMRATYSIHTWSDEPDTYPAVEGGYTNPTNPWGGLRWEVPEDLIGEEFARQRELNADYTEFDSVDDAAQFVADFPGGVWNWEEGEYERQSDGTDMDVTLHVPEEHQVAVFAAADKIRAAEKAKLQEYLNR